MLITEKELKQKHAAMIKNLYKENFQRDITDEEIDEIFLYLIPRMEDELKNIKGFSEAEFERYMTNKNNELLFSPMNIHSEMNRVIQREGVDSLIHAGKYKRLREMEIATRYCIANYKRTGDMLMVKVQDNPDIVFVLMGSDMGGKNVVSSRMEIMSIPEIAKEKLGNNLPASIAKFIQEKKFSKDYGSLCSLMVCLDFNQEGLNFDQVAQELKMLSPNPYHSIWLTFVSEEDGTTISVIQVHPGTVAETYNLTKEPHLKY